MSREPTCASRARRSFLRAVGGAATALPFYRLLEDNVALAAAGQLPLRFVGVGMYHTAAWKYWARQAGETDDTYDIAYPDCALRPFDQPDKYGSSFKKKLIVFEGFDYGPGQVPVYVEMHGSLAVFLTGSAAASGSGMNWNLQNWSLDQYLAAQYGGATKFRSIEMSVESGGGASSESSIAAGQGGKLITAMTSPAKIWDKFFASLVVSSDPAARAAADRKRAIAASILDYVVADIQRVEVRLAGAEKQKLDQHLTAIRDLEKQLTALPPAVSGCRAPVRHAETGNASAADNYIVGSAQYNDGDLYVDRIADFQIELLAQILACDLTRFATIVLPHNAGGTKGTATTPALDGSGTVKAAIGTDLPIPANFHNEIAHKLHNPDVQRGAASMNRYYYGKIARLMQRLQEAGVLDSTVILAGNEGGDGASHTTANVPMLLAGGANGALRMGRRIVHPRKRAQVGAQPAGDGKGPTSHSPILVAVANLFHAAEGKPPIDSFGTCPNADLTRGIQGLI